MKLLGFTLSALALTGISAFAQEQKAAEQATTQQSTTTIQKAAPEAVKRNWSLGYVNESRFDRSAANVGAGAADLRHYFSYGYKFAGGKLSLTQQLDQSHNVNTDVSDFTTRDPYLKWTFNKAKMNHDWTLDSSTRYYVPTSAASKENSSNGIARVDLTFKKPLNDRLAFTFDSAYFHYFQTRNSSLVADSKAKNPKIASKISIPDSIKGMSYRANTRSLAYNLIGLEYTINKSWSFAQQVGQKNAVTYGDANAKIGPRNEDALEIWSYLSYEYSPKFSVIVGLEQERGSEHRASEPDFALFADNETNYYFSVSLGI